MYVSPFSAEVSVIARNRQNIWALATDTPVVGCRSVTCIDIVRYGQLPTPQPKTEKQVQ